MNHQVNDQPTRGWDTFWQGADDSKVGAAGGLSHPVFPGFWSMALGEFVAANPAGKVLDIGTGSGAVIEYLSQAPGANLENATCVDLSAAAINIVQERFPAVGGVVADANNIPLESGQFDLVTSQFGIEYAGATAADEAVRLLSPSGSLLFLIHIRPGELHRECIAAADALRRVTQSNLVPLAVEFFTAGFAAVQGGDREPYDSAARALNPAIKELEAIMTEHGEHVAGDMLIYLHTTLQNMHSRIQHYDPDEVFNWLTTIGKELEEHERRMLSMRDAAMDEEAFKAFCSSLDSKGLGIDKAMPMQVKGEQLPVAWLLQATRASDAGADTSEG
ncbi:MAG: class I SAM-dependent methyltransferase [Gammaproteobacteria bacterium]|nr:class I SAM-dependent methyltransferase [Gammaproteobacteria bacterium]